MSKIFDAIKQAERSVAESEHSESVAASVAEETRAQSSGSVSVDGSAAHLFARSPNLAAEASNPFAPNPHIDVVQSGETKAPPLRAGTLNPDTNSGGPSGWKWPWQKARSTDPGPSLIFGDLGKSLEIAAKSPFWQWFHLEQTCEENGVHRFQPAGSEFRSLCYVDVKIAKNEMRAMTLGVQRVFVSGEGEPFARDLVRSFLCVLFPKEKSEAISRFADELGTEFGGSRPANVAEGTRHPAPLGAPSSLYLVFLGQGKRCAMEFGGFQVEEENVTDGSTQWLCLRVRPRPATKKKSFWKNTP